MPAVLADPPAALWIALLIFALAAVGFWARSRGRGVGLIAIIALLLPLLLYLCGFGGESPRQEATRRMKAIIAAMDARNPDAMLPHVAEDFDYQGRKKKDIKFSPLWGLLKQYNAKVSAAAFGQDDQEPDANTVVLGFTGWGSVDGKDYPAYVRATFKKDARGEYKLQTLKAYSDPVRKINGPEFTIPGM